MLLKWICIFKLQLTMGLCRFSLEGVFSVQTVSFHLLCCSEVAISRLDHAAGNLELSPRHSASQTLGISFKRSKCSWRVRSQKPFGALSASVGMMRNELIPPLVSCNFLRFSIFPSVEFQRIVFLHPAPNCLSIIWPKCGSRNFLLPRRMG